MRKALPLSIATVAVGLIAGTATLFGWRTPPKPATSQPAWTETTWSMPIDQWGSGRMFVCMAADCGARVDLMVRPKIGFCNCATGVSDDAELERVGDTELIGAGLRPRGPGRPVKVGWMVGRSRAYRMPAGQADGEVLSLAYNDECDVVVAVATFKAGDAAALEPTVVAFLNTKPMVLWAKKELGLEFIQRNW